MLNLPRQVCVISCGSGWGPALGAIASPDPIRLILKLQQNGLAQVCKTY